MIQTEALGVVPPPTVAVGLTTATSALPSPSKSPETGMTLEATSAIVTVMSVGLPLFDSWIAKTPVRRSAS